MIDTIRYRKFKQIIKFTFGIIFILNILFVAIYFFGARYVGALEAKYNLMRGRYGIRSYGLGPFMAYQPYMPVFKSRGIRCIAVAGCVANDFIIESVAAYNAVMRSAILDKFGIDIERWKHLKAPE